MAQATWTLRAMHAWGGGYLWVGLQTIILRECAVMYVGGVFNPVSLLPDWAQRLSLANPLLYMVNAVRFGLLGISDVPVALTFWVTGAAGIALTVAALALLAHGKGIRD
jgi:ABC-type polysaccharide/polyol phosphate export permease